jgi:hypothetical protein
MRSKSFKELMCIVFAFAVAVLMQTQVRTQALPLCLRKHRGF